MTGQRRYVGVLVAACVLAFAGGAGAEEARARSVFDSSPSAGIEVGNPTGVIIKVPLLGPKLGVGVGLGSEIEGGSGFLGHADLLVTPLILGQGWLTIPVHLGVGMRYYRHHYRPASVDEIPDRHVGVRFPVGLGVRLRSLSLEAFAEVAPGWDVSKTASCNLYSGTRSICPHEDDRFFLHMVAGARYAF